MNEKVPKIVHYTKSTHIGAKKIFDIRDSLRGRP